MRALSLLLLVGCGGPELTGLWLLTLERDPSDALVSSCRESVDENFLDAVDEQAQEEESNWTETETSTATGLALVVRLETLSDGGAALFFADAIYPGEAGDGDGWTFSWTDEAISTSTTEHSTGYAYEESETASATLSWHLVPGADGLTGAWSGEAASSLVWAESDTWDSDEVGLGTGQIPASSYLVNTESYWDDVENTPDEADCEAETCELSVTTTCGDEINLTGAQLELEDQDTIEDVLLSTTPDPISE